MRYVIKKVFVGASVPEQKILSDSASDVPKQRQGWGEIHAGWKTQAQFDADNAAALALSKPQVAKGESRIVTDEEAIPQVGTAEVPAVGTEGQEGYVAAIPASADYAPEVPAVTHEEWMTAANYDIVVEDTESSVYKIAHYAELRTGPEGYASLGEQLDMQYKDALNGTTTWKDHIASVKAKFPKA